jgi:SPP1 family predicted phage head-tail adaptor
MTKFRINPGKYRHPITLQTNAITKNSYGEPSDTWVDTVTTRASISPISGREFFDAERTNSEVSHKVSFRYVEGVNPKMRVSFNNRFFEIISVINFQEMGVELQLLCKELVL